MAERLQKIIAESGLMSRRAAELAISDGRVWVNGHPAKLGDRAESDDTITLDGEALPVKEEKRYYMLNKPRGYVCSLHDLLEKDAEWNTSLRFLRFFFIPPYFSLFLEDSCLPRSESL